MTPRQSKAITERRQALRNAGKPYARVAAVRKAHAKRREARATFWFWAGAVVGAVIIGLISGVCAPGM